MSNSPTKEHVDTFAELMERRLDANRHKGDREGWMAQTVFTHLDHAKRHLLELETALLHGRVDQFDFDRLAADCANRLMMARDRHRNG